MLINSVQNFKLNAFNLNKPQDSSKLSNFRQSGLVSDTVSFGNKNYTLTTYQETFEKDMDFAELLLSQPTAKAEKLTEYKNKMENHFHGILKVLKKPFDSSYARAEVCESLYKSKFAYQLCSESLGEEPRTALKLEPELLLYLEKGGYVQLTPKFMLEYQNFFILDNATVANLEELAKDAPDSLILFESDSPKSKKILEDVAKRLNKNRVDEFGEDAPPVEFIKLGTKNTKKKTGKIDELYNPLDEAENVLKNLEKRRKQAIDRINLNTDESVKLGLKDLVEIGATSDIEKSILDFHSGMHKLPAGLKLNSLAFDIGSMLKNQEGILSVLLKDKNLPELLRKAIWGGAKF